jgi:capsid protein
MGIFSGLWGGKDYNSLQGGDRKRLRTRSGTSEMHLGQSARKNAIANTRDLRRNFAVAAWGIRKHLDYVSDFRFKAMGDNEQLKQYLTTKFYEWSKKSNFDQSGRFNLNKAVRLMEASRTVDGDVFAYKLRNGRVQLIEADRVKNMKKDGETEPKNASWVQGLLINDKTQRVEKVRVGKRDSSGNVSFLADVNKRDILHLAYVERIDQWRGISPILSAMSIFQDQAEASEYALAKLKISQLFGIAFHRDGDESMGDMMNNGTSLDDILDPADINPAGYDVNLGKGPFQLDLDPGDKVDLLESQNPSNQAQDYMLMMIEMALKCLDFPVSFYDESRANFAGAVKADQSYEKSTLSKKADIREFLSSWFMWKIDWAIANGDTYLAENKGAILFEFVSAGLPWFDNLKESKAVKEKLSMGLTNPQKVAKQLGEDYEENIKEIAEAKKLADKYGVSVNFGVDDSEEFVEEMQIKEERK